MDPDTPTQAYGHPAQVHAPTVKPSEPSSIEIPEARDVSAPVPWDGTETQSLRQSQRPKAGYTLKEFQMKICIKNFRKVCTQILRTFKCCSNVVQDFFCFLHLILE